MSKVRSNLRYEKKYQDKKWDNWSTQDHADFCTDIVSDLMKKIKRRKK